MKKNILVVEDNDDVRENICEILELAGYRTTEADNGADGIRKAIDIKPDLILCDVMMPKLDGYAMLKMLRDNAHTAQVPFIFLTAKAEQADFRKGMGLGADDYIMKPFDDTNLLESVDSRLRRHSDRHTHFEQSSLTLSNQHSVEEWRSEYFFKQTPIVIHRGEYLFSFERPTKNIYYVQKGLAAGESFVDDRIFSTQLYGPGDIIGLATDSTKPFTVQNAKALKELKVYSIFKDHFVHEMSTNRVAAHYVYQNVLQAHEQLQRRSGHLAYSSGRKRVAESLLLFLDKDPGSDCILLPREDLANFTGVAKETLIRTLSSFKSEGMISIEGKTIRVLKPEQLRRLPQ